MNKVYRLSGLGQFQSVLKDSIPDFEDLKTVGLSSGGAIASKYLSNYTIDRMKPSIIRGIIKLLVATFGSNLIATYVSDKIAPGVTIWFSLDGINDIIYATTEKSIMPVAVMESESADQSTTDQSVIEGMYLNQLNGNAIRRLTARDLSGMAGNVIQPVNDINYF